MPYPGIEDPEQIAKMDACVEDVMAKGNDKDSAIAICMMSVMEGMDLDEAVRTFKLDAELSEVVTKTEDGKQFPASDFAYVPDPESPSTWKLRLTATPGGEPDSGIVGAAIAALGKGFRGNKVEIPAADLPGVKAKVRAAWKKANPDKDEEDMPPAIKENEPVEEAATIKSRVRAAIKALDELLEDKEVPELMRTQVKNLRETFRRTWADLATDAHSGGTRQIESEPESSADGIEKISESFGGVIISETDGVPGEILSIDFQPIRPGPGNSRDGHWYDAALLKSTAAKLVGAKMYESDHKAGEKSTRTWVSTITELKGFKDDGTPIMRAAIHDPNFAQRVKNLSSGNLLEKLECSLLASGKAKNGIREGKQYKVVDEITEIESVDWVTRAGAGGHALDIAESDPANISGASPETNTTTEGASMADQTQIEAIPVESPATEPAAPVADPANTSGAEVAEEQAATAPEVTLSEADVTALLEAEKRLPAASRVRLAENHYPTAEDVNKAILKELEYLKKVLGSGQPFALGTSADRHPAVSLTPAEREAKVFEALDKVNQKYFGS